MPLDVDHAVRTATVDGDGRFEVDALPRGRWRVEAQAPGWFQDGAGEVAVAPGRAAELEVALARAGTVTGVVVDDTGAPVAHASLVLRGQGAVAAVPSAALASGARPGGALRWVHPLAAPRALPRRPFNRFGAPRSGARPADCGRGHCGVDLGFVRGATVHAAADGVVARAYTELRGEAGRYVAIDHPGGLRSFYMHLQDLRPDLEVGQRVRAGEPIGTVGATGDANGPHLHFALTQERDGRTWYLDPEPILREAVVLASPGSIDAPGPRTGATVVASPRGATPAGATAGATATPAPAPTTDAEGRFRLDGVLPGDYVAVAFHDRLAPGTSEPLRVRAGATTDGVSITLSPGVVVHGRVRGPAGAIAGARVVADEGSGETRHKVASTFTDATGEFTLRALAGTITVEVTAPGHGAVERTLALTAATSPGGRHQEDFDLTVEDGRLWGVVLDPDDLPAAGVEVRVVDGPTRRRSAITDGQGRFLIDRVADGRYVVELSSAAQLTRRATVHTGASETLRLEQGGSLAVQLRDVHTAGVLAGLRVDASGPDGRALSRATGADGVAILPALVPGRWRLRVRAPGYVVGELVVDVAPSRYPRDVRLELARGATLAGVVRDRYGERVADVAITVGTASTHSDHDGEFHLLDVPTGAVVLTAERAGARAERPLELRPGDELLHVDVELPDATP
ncbi:MAG: carboxypeptidase regulatory-like domain-containing protein [Kofleriaceae bacterium]|nr:carboxypeptidase regulatory-like domain-containing protein [Kofleriaceae bacterium]